MVLIILPGEGEYWVRCHQGNKVDHVSLSGNTFAQEVVGAMAYFHDLEHNIIDMISNVTMVTIWMTLLMNK